MATKPLQRRLEEAEGEVRRRLQRGVNFATLQQLSLTSNIIELFEHVGETWPNHANSLNPLDTDDI